MFLAIDLDAFYCGVEERQDASLRSTAFCVVQKEVIATLSYPARDLGIAKLANAKSVLAQHPGLRMVNGENLAKYRRAGKEIFDFVQGLLGGAPVERLGLEEMRFDVRADIDAVCARLGQGGRLAALLDDDDFMDDVAGFGARLQLGGTSISCPDFYFQFDGGVWPSTSQPELRAVLANQPPAGFAPPTMQGKRGRQQANLRAYIGACLAVYVRDRIWHDLGYSCSIGVGPTKNLAKMVGAMHKPKGVTLLLPGHEAAFVRSRPVAKVPGFGRSCRGALETRRAAKTSASEPKTGDPKTCDPKAGELKVGELLDAHGDELPEILTSVLGADAAGDLLSLLHGEDRGGLALHGYTRPQQISIEETWATFCPTAEWPAEVTRLAAAVVDQALLDWYDDEAREWAVRLATVRVSCIFANQAYVRKSRSARFAWQPYDAAPGIAHRLARAALPLLRDVAAAHAGRPRMINVALVV